MTTKRTDSKTKVVSERAYLVGGPSKDGKYTVRFARDGGKFKALGTFPSEAAAHAAIRKHRP